jgi:hypothetical protein
MLAQRGSRIIINIIATNCLIRRQNLRSQVLSINHASSHKNSKLHLIPHRQFKEL